MARGSSFVRVVSRVLALASFGACSEKAPLPGQLGDCDAGSMCGSTGGQGSTTGGTPGDSSASCGQIVFRDPRCNTCVQGMCCDRDAKCTANPDCLELVSCVSACPSTDQTCRNACRDKSQNGIADYDNFVSCVATGCDTDCAGADAGSQCGALVFQSAACTTCMSTNCCSESGTCSNNPACAALLSCASACSANDQACVTNCRTLNPNGSTDYTSLNQCALTNCSTQCR